MRVIRVNEEDYANILGALQYAADDYSYRADFEDRHLDAEAPEEAREEQYAYERASESYSHTHDRLIKSQEHHHGNPDPVRTT